MNIKYYSLRIKLDDVILNEDFEKKVLENIRYCRKLVGKQFRVIFWNENLSDTAVKDFVEQHKHILYEINTEITKKFNMTWYLIQSDGDKSRWRYKSEGDILDGIASYIKLIKHMNKGPK
jgi:hypothetical protein